MAVQNKDKNCRLNLIVIWHNILQMHKEIENLFAR